MTINEYASIEYKEENGFITVSLNGDDSIFEPFESMIDAQDTAEDYISDEMKVEFKYYCGFCQEYFYEPDVEHRIEDSRFTAPYGSTIVIGGDVSSVPVCPFCNDDLEEL